MKNWHFFSSTLILFFLLSLLSLGSYAQRPNDLRQDLRVSFSSKDERGGPGYVVGTVRNNSGRTYRCVRIKFELFTHIDDRRSGRTPRDLGDLSVVVHNFHPRQKRHFEKKLPVKAGFGLKSVNHCKAKPARRVAPDDPPARRVAPIRQSDKKLPPTLPKDRSNRKLPDASNGTCSISGRVSGKLQWNATGDRGQSYSFKLEEIVIIEPGTNRPMFSQVRERKYKFANVPSGKTYRISPGQFRSEPREILVRCEPNKHHRRKNFKITGLHPID